MYEELMQLAAELRTATDHIKLTMDRFATIGGEWVDAIDYNLKRQNFAGLVQFYESHSEIPYGLDQPFLWHLPVRQEAGLETKSGPRSGGRFRLFRSLGCFRFDL